MNKKIQSLFENLIPFLMLGVAISLIIGLFIMFSYVLVWGLLIGGILWVVSLVKTFFFPSNTDNTPIKTKGRVIEHNDKD